MERIDVGVWIRVSTQDQAAGGSPENHAERAGYQAKLKNWNIVETYDLSGVSGKSVVEHSETKRMLHDVETGKIKILVFSKLARLARSTKELLYIAEYFKKFGADLFSIDESLDTTTSAGKLLYTLMAALAEFEREQISERVTASVASRARQGKPTGGRPALGYKWDSNKKTVVDEDEAIIIKKAFDLYLETGKLKTTCSRLNEEGFRARRSKFSTTTLKRILTDRLYIGEKRANYSTNKGPGKSWELKKREEWVYYDVDPIVSKDIWLKVNSLINKNAVNSGKPVPKEGSYLFSGLLKCSCQTKLYVSPYKGMKIPKYICRNCRKKITEDVLEGALNDSIQKFTLNPGELISLNNGEEKKKNIKQNIDFSTRKIKKINREIDAIFKLFEKDIIDENTFSERFIPKKEQLKQLTSEIDKLKIEYNTIEMEKVSKEFLLDEAKNYSSMWPILNYDEKRRIIKILVESVDINENHLHFIFSYNPSELIVGKGEQTPRDSWQQPA